MTNFHIRLFNNLRAIRYKFRKRFPRETHAFGSDFDIAWGNISEDEFLLNQMIENLQPEDKVIDVGANMGAYSLPLASNGAIVYAFEPNSDIYDKLSTNISLNDPEMVNCYQLALGADRDERRFYLSSSTGRSSFYPEFAAKAGEKITDSVTVPVNSIDNMINAGEINPPDHLKIDVEGSGLEVLKGAKETIADANPIIYIEPHTDNLDESVFSSYIRDMDYEIKKSSYRWICRPTVSELTSV